MVKFCYPMRNRHFWVEKNLHQWDCSPGKPLRKFLPTGQDVLVVPRWPQMVCLVLMGVFPVSRFNYFWCFRSEILSAGFCIFFCVVMSFFTSLRYEIVPTLSLHFFVVVVMDVLFCCSWAYFYIISLWNVPLVLCMVNVWCCIFFLRYFCFSCLFFLSVLLFVFLQFCRCGCGLLLVSRCRFTPVFTVVTCSYFWLDIFGIIVCVGVVTDDVFFVSTPLTTLYLFLHFSPVLSCVISARNGHPWSSLSSFRAPTLNSIPLYPFVLINTHHGHPRTPAIHYLVHLCFFIFCIVLIGDRECVCTFV